MPKHRVLVEGQNFLMEMDGIRQRLGFFTHVFVEAADATKAETTAVEVLRNDQTLRAGVLNAREDPPRLVFLEIKPVRSFKGCTLPRTGLAFFPEVQK
jgi:hypothetical protein